MLEKVIRVVPKKPNEFSEYSGFYGESLPEYFLVRRATKFAKNGAVSYCCEDPRPTVTFMKKQFFDQSHFNVIKGRAEDIVADLIDKSENVKVKNNKHKEE